MAFSSIEINKPLATRAPALTGYFCQDHPEPPKTIYYWEKTKHPTWSSVRFQFVKKTSMPQPAESLGYFKCYRSSSPRPLKNPSSSVRFNCYKICSWSRRPEIILKIRILCSFRLFLERKASKRIPDSWRLEFLENLWAKNFALTNTEGCTTESLIRGNITDLSLLRMLLAIAKNHVVQVSGKRQFALSA